MYDWDRRSMNETDKHTTRYRIQMKRIPYQSIAGKLVPVFIVRVRGN